jgi:hypothetical protein
LKSFFQKRKLILVLKILIFLLLLWTVYEQAFRHQSFSHALQLFQQDISPFAILLLSFNILLMPINWLLEAKKWQLLINKVEAISLWTSIKAILSGITLGVITPYRVGDYAGRLVVLRKTEPIQAIAVTVVGNFAQIIITVMAGLASVCSYLLLYQHIASYLFILICLISIIVSYVLVDLYLRIHLTGNFLKRFSFYKKIGRYIDVLEKYNHKELVLLLLLSAIRYTVFAAQYLLLLAMFGIQIHLFTEIILIGTLFIIQAVVPVELWVRGNLALFIFSSFSNNSLGILSASLVLWLINLIIPALAGSIVIFKNNGLKNTAA